MLAEAATGLAAVTLAVSQYVNPNGVRVLVFDGRIESTAAGQTVDVLGQDCGTQGFRLISGTQTTQGGAYRVTNPEENFPWRSTTVYSGTTFRARWNDEHSAPYVWRVPASPRVTKIPGRRAWRVQMTPATPQGKLSLKGKVVELQRLSQGRWVRVRRARLAYKPRLEYGGAFNHEVVFAVPTRGLTLRAFVPAAPCFLPGASQTWRS